MSVEFTFIIYIADLSREDIFSFFPVCDKLAPEKYYKIISEVRGIGKVKGIFFRHAYHIGYKPAPEAGEAFAEGRYDGYRFQV